MVYRVLIFAHKNADIDKTMGTYEFLIGATFQNLRWYTNTGQNFLSLECVYSAKWTTDKNVSPGIHGS